MAEHGKTQTDKTPVVFILLILIVSASLAVLTLSSSSRQPTTTNSSSSTTSVAVCRGVQFSPPINGTPSICDLPLVADLSLNSTSALVIEGANLSRVYLQLVHSEPFQQRVSGFIWNTAGWGPYTMIDESLPTWGTYFPYSASNSGINEITPRGVAFWFQIHASNGTYFGMFFGASDLSIGNYTLSPFHPHPQQLHPP